MVKYPGKRNEEQQQNEMTTNITKTSWKFSQLPSLGVFESKLSKMSYSESEQDFSNFAINSLSDFAPIFSESKSEYESESDFHSVFINLDICDFFILYLHSSK